MRVLEVLIYVSVIIYLCMGVTSISKESKWRQYLGVLSILITILHLLIEGYRWQMSLAYVIVVYIGIRFTYKLLIKGESIADGHNNRKVKLGIIIIKLLFIVVVSLSMAVPILLPVVKMSEPKGGYYIGVKELHLVDKDRGEFFTKDSDDVRELSIKIWYPSDSNSKEKESYWNEENIKAKAYEDFLLPGNFWYEYLALSKTNSQKDVEISNDKEAFPVLIYSPSYGGLNTENTALCEELASHGYIVFSIAHTYEAYASIFPDGQVVKGDFSHIEDLLDYSLEEEIKIYEELETALMNSSDHDETAEIVIENIKQDKLVSKIVEIRAKDISFVIDMLEDMNEKEGMFENRLILDKVGALGFSVGGASSIEAAYFDERIAVTINLDGWPFGQKLVGGDSIKTPLLVFRSLSGGFIDIGDEAIWQWVKSNAEAEFRLYEIPSTMHLNYSDYPMMFEGMKYFGYYGKQNPEVVKVNYRIELIPFLDKYLK